MKITLNGATHELEPGSTVEQAVAAVTSETRGVAVAVNEAVVARGEWATSVLEPGDRVEVLIAVQGG